MANLTEVQKAALLAALAGGADAPAAEQQVVISHLELNVAKDSRWIRGYVAGLDADVSLTQDAVDALKAAGAAPDASTRRAVSDKLTAYRIPRFVVDAMVGAVRTDDEGRKRVSIRKFIAVRDTTVVVPAEWQLPQ